MSRDDLHKISYFPDSVVQSIPLPERFTFPFYYVPHPLARIAAGALQQYLETQTDLDHNFGLGGNSEQAIGKMFGVLVVLDTAGRPGYLCAFSGKLAGTNDHPAFVPPVFDMLVENSFFLKEQELINTINTELDAIADDADYRRLQADLERYLEQSAGEIAALKDELKANKENRGSQRTAAVGLAAPEREKLEAELVRQSLYDKHRLKLLAGHWKQLIADTEAALSVFEARAAALKHERRERSAVLQQQLFSRYVFLNKDRESKSLHELFSKTAFGKPPSAAGECATPKLLQYAFVNGYRPLAMAEFWWGASPKSEIRKHKHFYPACTGKCKPILAHMLEGIAIDENPFLQPATADIELEIVYEDDCFLVVNKPAGLRSVPGVDITDSVYTRLKSTLAGIEPLMVHRLDMRASGLLVVARKPMAHRHIQKQFLHRMVSKRYTALLSKAIDGTSGEISLPLCADVYNRPRQLVCFKTGKKSITRWQTVETRTDTTKVHFWPLTGRTHQLRMHAAHELGLDAPIVGDDLYGTAAARLYLHAASLAFVHPETKEKMHFEIAADF